MRKSKRILALSLAAIMSISAFAGCNGTDMPDNGTGQTTTTNAGTTTLADVATSSAADTKPYELSIILPYGDHSYDSLDLTTEFRKRLEKYTNTKITWELYDNDGYDEKIALRMATGDFSTIMVFTSTSADFINACTNGAFWDVRNYIDLFDNLATIPAAIRTSASNNGHLYGIPRERDLGRNVCAYRQDWADNLGLNHPETIDDLYNMAVAFTNNDPDGNGKNDTYGFALDGWTGQWNIMLPWFGCHNVWGFDENGNLEYYAMQEEYKTALKTFRQWYSEGLFPADFRTTKPGSADKALLRTNMAGISIQIASIARKAADAMNGTADAPGLYPDAKFTYFGAVDGGYGTRVTPTSGYGGYLAIPTAVTTTENDLMSVLQFINDLSDAEMRNLIEFGIEGTDYYIDANGYGVKYTSEEKINMGISEQDYRKGYNQLMTYFSNPQETAKLVTAEITSATKAAENQAKLDVVPYCIPNYGLGYTSETYANVGTELDELLTNAMLDFIDGTIDETQLDATLQQWLEASGQAYIDEMNAAYKAANN